MNKTILVDVDDTIEYLLASWIKLLNFKYNLSVDINDCCDWDMQKLFPTLQKNQIYEVLDGEELWNTVKPREDALQYLPILQSEGYNIFLVTATYYKSIKIKVEFLKKHFPFIPVENIIICYNKQLIKGDILVDDYIKNLVGGDYQGILIDAPHNRTINIDGLNIPRAYNWKEIYDLIHKFTDKEITMDDFEELYDEEPIEKDRSAESKRKRDWLKAISRFNLIKSICGRTTGHPIGYYRNNNEANANTLGCKKTKTKKANYRHKGGYGKATKYSPHDERRINSMTEALYEN